MDRHTPMSTPTQRGKSVYMTKEAIRLKNTKYRAWKRCMVTKTTHDKHNPGIQNNQWISKYQHRITIHACIFVTHTRTCTKNV